MVNPNWQQANMAVTQNWDWKKFNPRVRQTDKREREGLVIKGRKMVEKNLFELGTSSLVCVPEVNLDRTFKKINHIFPPNSPLERFFNLLIILSIFVSF